MVVLLVFDVSVYYLDMCRIDRKSAVSILPVEIPVRLASGFDPFGRMLFYVFQQFYQGDFFGKHAQDVYMVVITAHLYGAAFQRLTHAAYVGKKFFLYGIVDEGLAMLGAEYEVYVHLGE
jgi:hypothetical protein